MRAEHFNQMHVENIRLCEKDRDTQIKYYFVDQEIVELVCELKMVKGESSWVKKRSRVEGGEGVVSIHDVEYKKALAKAKERIKQGVSRGLESTQA